MRLPLILFGVAFLVAPAGAVAQDDEHSHDHTHDKAQHSHRGPGPHFIDAFFTENAYIERKLRPDLFFASGDRGDVATAQLEIEWALVRNFSLIMHAPVHRLTPDGLPAETGIGDVSVGAKLAAINDRRRFILAVGADLELATGDEARGLGEEHAAAAPFVLGWLPFGPERRWLLQGGGHLDVPLEGDEDPHAEVSAVVSWTSPLGVTPIVETIAEFSTGGGPVSWAIAPEFRWEFAEAWEVGAAVRIPVGGPNEENYRVAFGLIRHFALPQ